MIKVGNFDCKNTFPKKEIILKHTTVWWWKQKFNSLLVKAYNNESHIKQFQEQESWDWYSIQKPEQVFLASENLLALARFFIDKLYNIVGFNVPLKTLSVTFGTILWVRYPTNSVSTFAFVQKPRCWRIFITLVVKFRTNLDQSKRGTELLNLRRSYKIQDR